MTSEGSLYRLHKPSTGFCFYLLFTRFFCILNMDSYEKEMIFMDLKKLYIEHAVYPAMALLQNNRVTEYTRELLASETLPADQRAANLRQRLSELLFLCRRQVPAYADLSFTDLELRREPMDCLQAVDPILLTDFLSATREYLRRDADVLSLHKRYCDVGTQNPAMIYLTQEQIARYEAARWRGLSWYGATFGSPSVYLWDQPHSPFVIQEEPYLKNRLSISVCAMTDRSVQPTADEIDGFKPEYITGSASSLGTMAQAMLQTGVRLVNTPKVVTITRGVADAALRLQLEDAFQCPVAQVLGGRMEGLMAYMCPEGHLHITAENCYVELLDPKTWAPVPAGHRGLVTVTNLLDETMPHLRVILDYMATMPAEPCPCGRTLPVLENLQKVAPA